MEYVEHLKKRADEVENIICMGMDPVLKRIPIKGEPKEVLVKFFSEILNAMESEDLYPACVKPNIAFYEQYGIDGLKALKQIIEAYKKKKVPVILDAKRGDIGKTCNAYADAIFDYWKADAVTVHPYLGSDSILPFTDKGGVYVLVRTSNKSAIELQDLKVGDEPVYREVAKKVVEWGTGAVVGATYPEELEELSRFFVASGKDIPLLIPGVGAQGGSAADVCKILKKTANDLRLHRINSSSGINFAYEKQSTDDFGGAAVNALLALKREAKFD